jgi:Ser/Thr protein kinase RdoA (MazF antagonist)
VLLKVTNAAEPREITRFQTDALLEIARADPSLPVPRIVPTLGGEAEHVARLPGQGESVVRLLTYLHGEPLHRTERSPAQRHNIARCLARLDIALAHAAAPTIPHELQWDIRNAPKLRPMMDALTDPAQHAAAEAVLDTFEQHVAPVLQSLRRQVIHNDFNPHNILVAPDDPTRVTGILDFGDMVFTPLVIDVATACAYQVAAADHPLHTVGEFIAAYHGANPLTREEFTVIFPLIQARLVTTLIITNWRARRYPANRTYILRNTGPSLAALEQIGRIGRAEAEDYFLRICDMR